MIYVMEQGGVLGRWTIQKKSRKSTERRVVVEIKSMYNNIA